MGLTGATPVPVGSLVNVTVLNITYDCDVCGLASFCTGDGDDNLTASGTKVTFGLLGAAWAVDGSGLGNQLRRRSQASFLQQNVDVYTENGEAWLLVQIGEEGPVSVSVEVSDFSVDENVFEPNAIAITGLPAPTPPPPPLPPPPPAPSSPPVAKLLLRPAKAYRRVHDSITLTAQALDTNDKPVVNAAVSFSSFGDCQPIQSTGVGTTDAAGLLSLTLTSSEPGALAVVAAAVNAEGVAVLSDASHVIFFDTRRYVEDREPEYYDHGRPGQYEGR